jgi:hypothetical protein
MTDWEGILKKGRLATTAGRPFELDEIIFIGRYRAMAFLPFTI